MRVSARGALAVLSAALVVSAATPLAGAASVHVAKSPGWRVFKTFGCASGIVFGLTSTGQDGSWATGRFTPCAPGAATHMLLARWDGRSWEEPPLPPAGASAIDGNAVAALSNSYSWTFGDGVAGSFAWLYRSGRWRTFQLPDSPYVSSAVVFSRSNVWAFGETSTRPLQYAARFNGRTWRRVGIPVAPAAMAAPTPSNIWVLGSVANASEYVPALAHWTGQWKVIPLPAPPSGEQISGEWVNWDNAHGVWVVASLVPTVTGGYYRWLLLHWTGSRWFRITYPYQTFRLGPFAHDGHGGLWIASGSCRSCLYTDMVHYSPSSGWSKPVPAGPVEIEAMRLIPGTESVLAAGIRSPSPNSPNGSAVVLKYGR